MGKIGIGIKALIFVILIAHIFFSFFVSTREGLFFAFPPFRDLSTWQIFWDLVLALSFANLWIYFDTRKFQSKNKIFWSFFLAIGFTGSIGLYVYLLVRDRFRLLPQQEI